MPTTKSTSVMEPPVLEEELYEQETEQVEPVEQSAGADEEAPLTGADLLEFYESKQAEGMSHKDIAYQAGYFSVTKNGLERVNSTQFNEALLEAKGVPVTVKRSSGGRGRAGLTRARVSGQGVLLVSQLAVKNVGAEPGAVFAVSYPGDGQILLAPTGEVVPIRKRGEG